MTVKMTMLDKNLSVSIGDVSIPAIIMSDECKINNENLSPCNDELMVAVKPSVVGCSLPLVAKTAKNITSNLLLTKKTIPVGKKLIMSKIIHSPVKRPFTSLDSLTFEAPSDKRSPTPDSMFNTDSNNCQVSSAKLLSQSAGSSSQLQSAINRVKTSLSQSCFADLRASRSTDIDNDLRSLNWLQEGDLLNGFNPGANQDNSKDGEQDEKMDSFDIKHTNDPLSSISEEDKSLRKPAYSFSTLIFMAIENAKDKRLPVKDIYQWIQDNFPYFQKAPIGWKNSVRHNLSLNKSFKKVGKEKCIGKGSLWTIDHEARAGLVQQLRKTTTYHSYPYSRSPYPHGCSKYLSNKTFFKRDIHGRFIPNHDDTEFDVAAAMCSMSSPASFRNENRDSSRNVDETAHSEELLKIWRTHIEPYEEQSDDSSRESSPYMKGNKYRPMKTKYSIEDFLDEVKNKLSFKPKLKQNLFSPEGDSKSFNTSMDEDYEFYNSDEESDEDDEMAENMKRLVEKERDDGLCDSGYSEEGAFKHSAMLEHSYSKSINSLVRPQIKREVKGVAALLHLANAASKELENLNRKDKKQTNQSSMEIISFDIEQQQAEMVLHSSPVLASSADSFQSTEISA